MLESRSSYGYGYVGTNQKGFEWRIIYGEKPHERIRSGYVYKTEKEAMAEGEKFLKNFKYHNPADCTVTAIKAESRRFEY